MTNPSEDPFREPVYGVLGTQPADLTKVIAPLRPVVLNNPAVDVCMSKKCADYPAIHVGRVVFTESVAQAITVHNDPVRDRDPRCSLRDR
jgi:hypothetical protein